VPQVFYSDDGSTGIEVALKMAFRKFMVDHGLLQQGQVELQVSSRLGKGVRSMIHLIYHVAVEQDWLVTRDGPVLATPQLCWL
jgi:hypothetical protein